MTGVWLTSDTHLAHEKIVRLSNRPFGTVEEMTEAIVERWNRVVRPDDQVWHLGDVGMGKLAGFAPVLRRLNGRKHLITGNHDEVWPGHREAYRVQRAWLEHFDTVQAYGRRRIAGMDVLLSHFPYRGSGDHTPEERYPEYRFPDMGAWLVHGHVHGLWAQRGRQINVGVDVRDFTPVSLDEIAHMMATAPEGVDG